MDFWHTKDEKLIFFEEYFDICIGESKLLYCDAFKFMGRSFFPAFIQVFPPIFENIPTILESCLFRLLCLRFLVTHPLFVQILSNIYIVHCLMLSANVGSKTELFTKIGTLHKENFYLSIDYNQLILVSSIPKPFK